ncbi:MAG: glutamate--tRNA ligase [Burkholderiales bacterium]|nr:glutamate--tRNA ligase [Burkholderiales bacterium]
MTIRTRFAPSPTGYLHIGGARTALFSWAFARRHGGTFILRIEDTDVERSTAASTQAILDAMDWLGLDYDEGPFYQMQRLERYREVVRMLLDQGKAYRCYASREELDEMREAQRARGEKPRYDGRWRPENAHGKTPPAGVEPIIRFRNPDDGVVTWDDLVKGEISVANAELDDLVIMRADGVPTYNFGVVVDDWDMAMTHVIRGDDHVNNTPRQINIYHALGAPVPRFGHVPMILGEDGERLSKRHGAVGVMQYFEEGYLPEAVNNYFARLGWSHGDDEIFSMEQFVEWFDLAHISRSPARFSTEKLVWLNAHYLKLADDQRLAALVQPFMVRFDCDPASGPPLDRVVALLKDRVGTIAELAQSAIYFYRRLEASEALREQHYSLGTGAAIDALRARLGDVEWNREAIGTTIKTVAKELGLKMPRLAMPLRVIVTGEAQTPAIDAVLELLGREETLARIDAGRLRVPD